MQAGFRFAEPWWLLLAGLAVLPWLQNLWPDFRLAWPVASGLLASGRLSGWFWSTVPTCIRSLTILLLAAALARPQTLDGLERAQASGITIVVALDVSSSMAKSRGNSSWLQQAKDALVLFIGRRPNDQIGLVAFARSPDTTSPPTLDHRFLVEAARSLAAAPHQEAGTSLGDALIWAGQEALGTQAVRRVIVLISDGREEPGSLGDFPPLEAAALAHELGIGVHVLALGLANDPALGAERPEAAGGEAFEFLAEIARLGGGQMIDASAPGQFETAFDNLDRLERTLVAEQIPVRFIDWFNLLLGLALVGLVVDLLLRSTRCKVVP